MRGIVAATQPQLASIFDGVHILGPVFLANSVLSLRELWGLGAWVEKKALTAKNAKKSRKGRKVTGSVRSGDVPAPYPSILAFSLRACSHPRSYLPSRQPPNSHPIVPLGCAVDFDNIYQIADELLRLFQLQMNVLGECDLASLTDENLHEYERRQQRIRRLLVELDKFRRPS